MIAAALTFGCRFLTWRTGHVYNWFWYWDIAGRRHLYLGRADAPFIQGNR